MDAWNVLFRKVKWQAVGVQILLELTKRQLVAVLELTVVPAVSLYRVVCEVNMGVLEVLQAIALSRGSQVSLCEVVHVQFWSQQHPYAYVEFSVVD